MQLTATDAATRPLTMADKPTCPFCRFPAFGAVWAIGDVHMWCKRKHCGKRFRAIALPRGTIGRQLLDLFGADVGRVILRRVREERREVYTEDALTHAEGIALALSVDGDYLSVALYDSDGRPSVTISTTVFLAIHRDRS